MGRSCLRLGLLVGLFSLLGVLQFFRRLEPAPVRLLPSDPYAAANQFQLTGGYQHAEDRFARGQAVELGQLDTTSLFLIPGVGDVLARRIVAGRKDILMECQNSPDLSASVVLTRIKGIGAKRSAFLSKYIETTCASSQTMRK